jgi:hypothetical protein
MFWARRKGCALSLEQALQEWVDAALAFINANDGVVRAETDTWVRQEDRFVRKTWNRLVYRPEVAHWTLRIPEFGGVVQEMQQDATLSSMFRCYVGPQSGFGTTFNERGILELFLPDDIDPNNPKRRFDFDKPQFDESYRELARFRDEREISFTQIRALVGLESEEPIEIEPGLRIEPMNDEELGEMLSWGALPTHMNQFRECRLAPGTMLALKRRYALPRAVLPTYPGTHGADEHTFERDAQVPHVLSIIAKGRVDLGPTFMYCTSGWPYGIHTIMQPKVFADDERSNRNMSLPRGMEQGVRRVWNALQGSAGFYRIAARRFYQGHLRELVEDRLIDDAICGEALLTAQSRSDKSLRFRLYAAYYLGEKDHAERLRVFGLFWSAYKVRSGIVHGNGPDPADVQIGGNPVKLCEFEEAFESELRRILRKMADTGDCAARIQWTGIVIGQTP